MRALVWLLIGACVALGGCATTQPWERGALAEEVMNPEGDPALDELNHHVLSTREGTSGSFGGGGGGCGCN